MVVEVSDVGIGGRVVVPPLCYPDLHIVVMLSTLMSYSEHRTTILLDFKHILKKLVNTDYLNILVS